MATTLDLIKRKEKKLKNFYEWNTLEGIELYGALYALYSQLFLATCKNKLACLNYYIDNERTGIDGEVQTIMYAEIANTWELPLKERYKKHLELYEKVLRNDPALEHAPTKAIIEDYSYGQRTIFSLL